MKSAAILAAILAAITAMSLGLAGAQAQPAPASAPAAAPARPAPQPADPPEHIRGNLYKIFGGCLCGNTLAWVTKDGVVLVDTKNANTGQAILDQVRTITDKPITAIINTHNHPDHVGSNDFFRATFPNVRIISQENTKGWIAANKRYPATLVPTETFKDRMTIGSGDERVELYYFGPAHTDGDTFVVIPAARTMFLGDVMAWNMSPLIDPPTGGTMLKLPDALEAAAKTIKGLDTVIEGHGYVNTWQGYLAYTEFNRAVLTEAQKAYAAGLTPDDALAELVKNPRFAVFLTTGFLPRLEYGTSPKARALMNINVTYQQLSGEKVTTNFGGALPATDKHKASSDPALLAPPRPARMGAPAGGPAPRPAPAPGA